MNNIFMNFYKNVPKTGVIYVLDEANKMGYSPTDPQWANLGQGAPETGSLENEEKTPTHVLLSYDTVVMNLGFFWNS